MDAGFVSTVGNCLRSNSWVRLRIPGSGRLHIDRQLPFLCIYRRPVGRPDSGTKSLLLGEASYLLCSADPRYHSGLSSLVREIVQVQGGVFGAFLILEIWAGECCSEGAAQFRILSPQHDAPTVLLEVLEGALLELQAGEATLSVDIRYRQHQTPPGLAPLISPGELDDIDCLQLGLEVPPLYRDPVSNVLYPFELERFRHELGRVLKRTFYLFSHNYTRHRPRHYHELGRHAMTSVVQKSDAALTAVGRDFDLLLHVTPVNVRAAWQEFSDGRFARTPEFHYRPRPVQVTRLKRRLFAIPLERIEDPTLAMIFAAKRDELDRQLTLIADRCTPRFLHGSQQIYGAVDRSLSEQARELLHRLPPQEAAPDHVSLLNASEFAERAGQVLERYRQRQPQFSARAVVREDVSGLLVSHGDLLIGPDVRVPQRRVAAVVAHEIDTHILTWHNGGRQPFHQLQMGLAGYETLQEGLAVVAEYLAGGLDGNRLRLLAGRVIAVECVTAGAEFTETFRVLHREWGFAPYTAFLIAMRVYRGGGFTKDAVYLRGLIQLLEYLGRGGAIEPLLLGKFSLEHLPFIEELRWRKILEPLTLRPQYLNTEEAEKRLNRLRQHPSLRELAER